MAALSRFASSASLIATRLIESDIFLADQMSSLRPALANSIASRALLLIKLPQISKYGTGAPRTDQRVYRRKSRRRLWPAMAYAPHRPVAAVVSSMSRCAARGSESFRHGLLRAYWY